MLKPHTVGQNGLLELLAETERAPLMAHLEEVTLTLGQSLFEPGQPIHHAYFPIDAIVSLLCVTQNGASSEIAMVGHEGVVGIPLFMGGDTTTSRAIVQSTGRAYKVKGARLTQAFDQGGALSRVLLRYTQALITQMSQTAVCNRHHCVDHQLCRWLLMSLDRLPGNELIMTQELIANMLGIRREGVTESAGKLQKAGLIAYHRGRIVILDRAGLETQVCECYAVVKNEYHRLLRPA